MAKQFKWNVRAPWEVTAEYHKAPKNSFPAIKIENSKAAACIELTTDGAKQLIDLLRQSLASPWCPK
jgi:hypothetical protein